MSSENEWLWLQERHANVVADDFYFTGILTPRSTDNPLGSNITSVNVETFPGLNTLGMGRNDFASGGVNPPHVHHPRASELLMVLEGTLLVELVSSNQNGNRVFSKAVNKGDVFLIPQGMAHFQKNTGDGNNAVGISKPLAANSQEFTQLILLCLIILHLKFLLMI
ncbi:germin-like protein subfamily 1 member 8 [Cucumis melo var. makuwa]|uniref:Germin-like protein n=1 Tax=Cucumis melo var. makuwa TaxID=1194695 RepID=A0A5A7UG45_CUCMM|nr:germin-like protein subfamily 1 member 8 [Cucumis melo var. makuwa]TYK13341.1 germin-like protein subfamily 1 member 8 [Cucumis melo var. makuwa]